MRVVDRRRVTPEQLVRAVAAAGGQEQRRGRPAPHLQRRVRRLVASSSGACGAAAARWCGLRALLRLRDERLQHEQQDRQAQRIHVHVRVHGLDLLAQLLRHHALEPQRDLADARGAVLGADDAAVRDLGDLRQLRFAFGRERGRQGLALRVGAPVDDLAGLVHLRDGLGRASADLHYVDGDVVACGRLRRR